LLDFGIARRLNPQADDALTRTGLVSGSPPFMPPEAFGGAIPQPTADVYAVAAVLREVVAGPLPEALEELLRRALDRDPARRPADGRALARALADVRRSLTP